MAKRYAVRDIVSNGLIAIENTAEGAVTAGEANAYPEDFATQVWFYPDHRVAHLVTPEQLEAGVPVEPPVLDGLGEFESLYTPEQIIECGVTVHFVNKRRGVHLYVRLEDLP